MIRLLCGLSNRLCDAFYKRWNLLKLKSCDSEHLSLNGNNHIIIGPFFLKIKGNGFIGIGDNLTIINGLGFNPISRNIRTSLCVEENAKIYIGDNVGMSGSCIWAHEKIVIGNNVNIGADTVIIDSDCHSLNYLDRRSSKDKDNTISKPITIEDDVLIGARSIILKGVTIGAKSIIGAGSVVTTSIPSGEIWAGNPAKFIRNI